MRNQHTRVTILTIFILFGLFYFRINSKAQGSATTKSKEILTLKFDPEGAIDFPFDKLCESIAIIDLERTNESKINFLGNIVRTDSFLIICDLSNYRIFNLQGKFVRNIGTTGDGPNSIGSLGFYYANNESILSFYDTKWIRYYLNGSRIIKGSLNYSVWPKSILPLDDSTWLFYQSNTHPKCTLRLWSVDQNYKIKKEYLSFDTNFPFGAGGFLKSIYKTNNGIYITDRATDTIYTFNEKEVTPVYVFDFGSYKYRRKMEMRDLDFNEASGLFTIVTSNSVIRKVEMNKKYYFIYHDKKTKSTNTIKHIINGPDILNSFKPDGSDNNDRFYWTLNMEHGFPTIDNYAIKYGYDKLMKRNQTYGLSSNPFLIVTKVR